MTIFEKFAEFAERLPDDRRAAIEELLADIMASEGADCDLTPKPLAELKGRMADPNPEYASPQEVEAFFARYGTR